MKKLANVCIVLALGLACLLAVSCLDTTDECRHSFGQPESVMPTCTEDGVYVYTCSLCGEERRKAPDATDEAMLRTEHREAFAPTDTVAATCTVDGYVQYSCVDCGATTRREVLTHGAHDTDGVSFVSEGGSHYRICRRCEEPVDAASCSFVPTAISADVHTDICAVCLTVREEAETASHRFTQTRSYVGTGACAVGRKVSICADCGYEALVEKYTPSVAHSLVLDRTTTSLTEQTEHTGGSHKAAYGTVGYRCTVCDERLVYEVISARTFDDACPCGSLHGAELATKNHPFTYEDGVLRFRGAINSSNYSANAHVVSSVSETAVEGLADTTRMFLSLDFAPAPAGLPEAGVKLSMKVSGGWTSGGMIHMYDHGIFIGSTKIADMPEGRTNIALALRVQTGQLSYDVYLNGAYVASGTKQMDRTPSLDMASSYAHLITPCAANNVDPNRGYDLDNFLIGNELPALMRAPEGAASEAPSANDVLLDENGGVMLPPVEFD